MQFSVVAALSLAASASALPAKTFAGKTVKTINAAAVSNYTWTVSDWNASGSDHTYSFVVSAPATTQGNTEIPAFTASCSGTGIGTGATPCTGTGNTNTSEALVNSYLAPSNDTSSAHLAVSYEYSTTDGQWGVTYNYTAFATEPWASGLTFTAKPSQVWGVE